MSNKALYLAAAEELRSNAAQWAAYESKGHCVVLAGPGSGKTKTLTTKLARILSEDIQEPRGIACITYNTECARELEQRLEALGVEQSNRVFIGTVHSFSLTQIVLPYAKIAKLGLPDNFCVANQSEQRVALQTAYDKVIGRGEDANRFWRLRLDRYRRIYLDRNKKVFKDTDPECAKLILAYEKELRAKSLIDFDDMPLLSVRALIENPWLQEAIKAKYPVLAVDEYQDLGIPLHQMVMGLCFSTGVRLFAVGDIDQSIYGFTGANPELLQKVSERADVEATTLRLNYRSGSKIVIASKYALGEDRDYSTPKGAPEGTIFFHPQTSSYDQQAKYLFADLLPAALKRFPGVQLGEIAILYPAAWIGDSAAQAAQVHSYGIIRTDSNAIYPRSSSVLRWLEQCAIWCCEGWKLGTPRFSKIVSEGVRIFSDVLASDDERMLFQRELLTFLWDQRNSTIDLHAWLSEFRKGILKPLLSKSRTLRDEAVILDAFIAKTDAGQECAGMTLGLFSGHGVGNDRINLSTFHSSKGREFRIVILFGVDAGRIPRNGANDREVRESRRLFYVGFTRAKEEVHMLFNKSAPSPFVIEVAQKIKDAE